MVAVSQIQTIRDGDTVIAIVIPFGVPIDGVKFISPPDYALQVGLIAHPAGGEFRAHRHIKVKAEIDAFQEFLVLQSGLIRIDLYGLDSQYLESVVLRTGDSILLVDGGHGAFMLRDSRVLEVKQGPYPGDDKAKERF